MKHSNFDIIGDVHGHATLLKKLLKSLGYTKINGSGWAHPTRTAVFIGDFINRGPEIRETLAIIKLMCENGNALAILGNHEYSAILYHIKDSQGIYLSRHIAGNRSQVISTLEAFKAYPDEWVEYMRWMRELPFYLDLGKIRVVHAYWNDTDIRYINNFIPKGRLKKRFLRTIHENEHPSAAVIYRLLKGLEFNCPFDLILKCNKGLSRRTFRMNWWESPVGKNFRNLSFGNKFILPEYTVPVELAPSFEPYGPEKPIVFVGHYCLAEGPYILQRNICCVDSCVVTTGTLTAYQYSGEEELLPENLVLYKL